MSEAFQNIVKKACATELSVMRNTSYFVLLQPDEEVFYIGGLSCSSAMQEIAAYIPYSSPNYPLNLCQPSHHE